MSRFGFDDVIRGQGPGSLLQEAIEHSDRSARQFAALLGVDERTVRYWLAKEREIPAPVVLLCALICADQTVVVGDLEGPDDKLEYVSLLEVLEDFRAEMSK